MKKTVLFVLLEQFADWEGAYLSSALQMLAPGAYEIKTVSLQREPVTSIGGLRALPDYDLDTVPADYEALFLIGGLCWREESARQVAPLVRAAYQGKRVLGGICDAAGFLATAGVLNEVWHTGNDLGDIRQWAGAAYTGAARFKTQQAVCDRGVITANGTAPLEFGREALLALKAAPKAKIEEWYAFHKLGYYVAPLASL